MKNQAPSPRTRSFSAFAKSRHRSRLSVGSALALAFVASNSALNAADVTWVGGVNGNWNITTANWSGGSTIFTNGDNVSFTDSGLTPNPTISVNAAVTAVGTMNVSNTSGTYQLTLAGPLSGTTLTKSGAGTLSLPGNNNVTFTNTNLQGGALIIRQSTFNGGAISVSGTVEVGAATAATTNLAGTTLTGSGELTLTPNGGTRMGLNADTSGFTGTLKASASGQVNMLSAAYNLSQAKVVLSGDTLFQGLTSSASLQIGEITTGSSNTLGNGTNSAGLIYQIGALNTASSIAGVIQNGGVTTAGGASTGSVGLTKVGTGTLSLTGANTYTAATTVNAGTLLIGNGTSGSIMSAATVNAGALYGNLASGNITTAGVIIGNGTGSADADFGAGQGSLGRFVSSSSLTLNSDAEFVFDLNSSAETTDTVTFGGAIALNGVFTLNDLTAGAVNWSANDSFTVVSGASLTGTFSNLADGATISAHGVVYLADYTGTALTLTVTTVPEPATCLLVAGGLAVVLFKRRRLFQV